MEDGVGLFVYSARIFDNKKWLDGFGGAATDPFE
jgi:hypothetical protein